MSDRKDLVFIKHILESIKAIEDFSRNLKMDELLKNRLKQSAIVREIEIIGEAVKNISQSIKNKNIAWKEIARTRDKMIHHYFGVDLNIVWDIIKINLPDLKTKILKIKKDLQ